jgi:molybdopterin molybdotransferase
MLRAMLQALGCSLAGLGILPDAPEPPLAVLIEVEAVHDLIITSGGASVGDADPVNRLIPRGGFMKFWRLNMRHGKPVGLGDIDDCPILVLPGNPMAAAVAFTLVGRRLIATLAGDPVLRPDSLTLPVADAAIKGPGGWRFWPGDVLSCLTGNVALRP